MSDSSQSMNNSWEDILLWPKSTLMASQYAPLILASTVGAGAYFGFQMDGLESVGLMYASGAAATWAFPGFTQPPANKPPPTKKVGYTAMPGKMVEAHAISWNTDFSYQSLQATCDDIPTCGGFQISGKTSDFPVQGDMLSTFSQSDIQTAPADGDWVLYVKNSK